MSISIHAPAMGCNTAYQGSLPFQFMHSAGSATQNIISNDVHYDISIHASRVGCNLLSSYGGDCVAEFQFMHPVRDATEFYLIPSSVHISIHASRVGCNL